MPQGPALQIIYRDAHLVAINKPHGLLVHRSRIAASAEVFALQLLRDQIEQYVYPIHRLDRKTSGLLLFALDAPTAAAIQNAIIQQEIHKEYLAIVRGYFPDSILVDHPLQNDRMKIQEAVTAFQLLQTTELPIPFGKHATSRYSLIRAFPKTGRMHQIRKHCNHLRHPIIGDRPHGCNKQNKLFKEKWNMTQMLLHAHKMKLTHPASKRELVLEAAPSDIFQKSLDLLKLRL